MTPPAILTSNNSSRICSTPRSRQRIVSNLWAPGVDISVNALDIEVLCGATVSTRELSPGTPNQLTDDSIGDSGNLTLERTAD